MARRTKEEAQATRSSILDAAERLFHQRGVSRTSLHDIAEAAGVTRGAVYWHFVDKGDLFNAMMDRALLPFEAMTQVLNGAIDSRPLPALRDHLVGVLRRVTVDEHARRSFEIATHKVEYIDELASVRARHLRIRAEYIALGERALRGAQKLGQVSRRVQARTFAIGLHAMVDGLLQNWLLDPSAFDLVRVGRSMIDLHLAGVSAAGADAAVPAAR